MPCAQLDVRCCKIYILMKYLNKHLKFTVAGLLVLKPTFHVCVLNSSIEEISMPVIEIRRASL